MWSTALAAAAFLALSEGSAGAVPDCPARMAVPDHIRPQNCALAEAVVDGLAHSAAFSAAVDRVAALNGAVFIQPGALIRPDENRRLPGALIPRIGRLGDRVALFVVVHPGRGDDTVVTIAHELQHVLEVLESGAATGAEVEALFGRIGVTAGVGIRETGAALEAGDRVRRELRQARRSRGGSSE